MKNYFYILFSGLPTGNAHRGSMKNYFYILFFGLPAGVAHRGTQKSFAAFRATKTQIYYKHKLPEMLAPGKNRQNGQAI